MTPRFPFSAFPSGWYVVTPSGGLSNGALFGRTLFGKELVVWRTLSGRACVADAFCPHMGAHFAHGGSVESEHLRCPFHDFLFDCEGTCVKTPYGFGPPAAARLQTLPVREKNGFVLAWCDELGRAPWFEVPEVPDDPSWGPLLSRAWTVRSHPQETTENSVDLGHLAVVHHYSDIETLSPLRTEGPYLNVKYAMRRSADIFGSTGRTVRTEFEIHIYGLGWSFVEVRVPEFGISSRHYVLPTPLDGERIELRIAIAVQALEEPKLISPGLVLMPRALATSLVRTMAWRGYQHDVAQDLAIWENKMYVHPPALARGDGPVGRYRQWARQFYADASAEPS